MLKLASLGFLSAEIRSDLIRVKTVQRGNKGQRASVCGEIRVPEEVARQCPDADAVGRHSPHGGFTSAEVVRWMSSTQITPRSIPRLKLLTRRPHSTVGNRFLRPGKSTRTL